MSLHLPLVFSSIGLASVIASGVSADFVTARWTSSTNYELSISHMTDFDQVRDDLPGRGVYYCVPTSTADLFAYIANHGRRYVAPGQADWEDGVDATYDAATAFIADLATRMGTSATEGTTMKQAYTGALFLLINEAGARFVLESESRSNTNVVTLKEMTKASIDDEAIQALCYGNYDILGKTGGGNRVIWRNSGHCMAFAGAKRSGTSREISYRDPASEQTDGDTQSAFKTTTKECPWEEDMLVFPTVAFSFLGPMQSMNWIKRDVTDGVLKLLDQRLSIRPASGASWFSYDSGLVGSVSIKTAAGTIAPGPLVVRTSSVNNPANVAAQLALAPSGIPYLLISGAQSSRLVTEVRNDVGSFLVDVDVQGINSAQITTMAFCGDRTLVACVGPTAYAIAGLDSGIPDAEETAAFIGWQRELPFTPRMIMSNHLGIPGVGTHVMLAFSDNLRTIFAFSGDPQMQPLTRTVPQTVQLDIARLGVTTVMVDRMGTLWFAQRGDTHVTALMPNGNSFTRSVAVDSIDDIAIDGLDNFLVVEANLVRCFSPTPKGFIETGLEGSPFAGQNVAKGFTVARSCTNYEARFHSGPEWRNSPSPPDAPICIGDIDSSGAVDGADMATLLGAWGELAAGNADLDGDGVVGGADLAMLLGNWGSCQ